MRFLAWHLEYLVATPTEQGRSTIVEQAGQVKAENALLVFANFEKNDEARQMEIVNKAVEEIASIAAQLKLDTIVINPFAHLFAEPSRPDVAKSMLDQLYKALSEKGFNVQKLAFGMFYELELKAKGHRLSRIARSII